MSTGFLYNAGRKLLTTICVGAFTNCVGLFPEKNTSERNFTVLCNMMPFRNDTRKRKKTVKQIELYFFLPIIIFQN